MLIEDLVIELLLLVGISFVIRKALNQKEITAFNTVYELKNLPILKKKAIDENQEELNPKRSCRFTIPGTVPYSLIHFVI